MLVGLQRMGKTTLLSRLKEVNETSSVSSTFNERVKGEEKGRHGRGRKKGGTVSGNFLYLTHTHLHEYTQTHTHAHTHTLAQIHTHTLT